MIRSARVLSAACYALLLLVCAVVAAEDKGTKAESRPEQEEKQRPFLRVSRDAEDNLLALQAAIVRCVPEDSSRKGPVVDLVSAVHVAEKSYYDELNRRFKRYDAVLYELVAAEGPKVPKGGGQTSSNPISFLQKAITGILELEFQLNGIDYTADNMVHADMSPKQFAESMRKRGETALGMFLRMMKHAIAEQQNSAQVSDVELLRALFDKNRALALKRILARQFQDMEGMLTALDGPDGSTIISGRNKVALEVLRKEIKSGKKKIAIFYGAGHMPDLLRRLEKDFAMTPESTSWVDAWQLVEKEKEKKKGEQKEQEKQKKQNGKKK